MEITELNEELFAKHLNTKFYVPFDNATVELELVEVMGDKSTLDKVEGVERFIVHFLGPGDMYLEQRTYILEHDALGQLYLFIVPLGMKDKRYLYEAVFNRLEEKEEQK